MTALAPKFGVYLEAYLAPLAPWLADPAVTDLYVNRPGELWVERLGGAVERVDVPALDETNLWRLARQVASLSSQGVSREHPLLSAVLPDGAGLLAAAFPGGMPSRPSWSLASTVDTFRLPSPVQTPSWRMPMRPASQR